MEAGSLLGGDMRPSVPDCTSPLFREDVVPGDEADPVDEPIIPSNQETTMPHDSEAPPPGMRIHDPGTTSARVERYIDERDPALDTIPAPVRDTMPPEDDAPSLSTWEAGLDTRFRDIRRQLREEQGRFEERMAARLSTLTDLVRGKLDSLQGSVRHLANETARANQMVTEVVQLRADMTRLETRCPHCSTPPQPAPGE